MIAFLSDVHLGNFKRFGGPLDAGTNARCCLILTALDEAIAHAKQQGCKVLIVAGDLLDYVRMEPQIISLVQETFREAKQSGLETVLLVGNHEIVSSAKGDHALGPFRPVAHVIEEATLMRLVDTEVALIPFITDCASKMIPTITNDLYSKSPHHKGDKARVLVFHAGIIDKTTPTWLRDRDDAIGVDVVNSLIEKHGIDLVIAGHYHTSSIWQKSGATVCQLGALVPTGWNNPGLDGYGGVAVFDPAQRAFSFHTVSGPRFVNAHIDDEEIIQAAGKYPGPVYLQMVAPVDRLVEAQGYKLELMESFGESTIEIVPDKIDAEQSARQAATVSRQQNTIAEALSAYVSSMAVPEGVKKSDVLNAANRYLLKGSSCSSEG